MLLAMYLLSVNFLVTGFCSTVTVLAFSVALIPLNNLPLPLCVRLFVSPFLRAGQASRMESNSERDRIHLSRAAAKLLLAQDVELAARLELRGTVQIKGKGEMEVGFFCESSPLISNIFECVLFCFLPIPALPFFRPVPSVHDISFQQTYWLRPSACPEAMQAAVKARLSKVDMTALRRSESRIRVPSLGAHRVPPPAGQGTTLSGRGR